jgi:hypothetical protein
LPRERLPALGDEQPGKRGHFAHLRCHWADQAQVAGHGEAVLAPGDDLEVERRFPGGNVTASNTLGTRAPAWPGVTSARPTSNGIVANPTRGMFEPPARDIIEHFGYAADGRALNVVTNRAEDLIITIVEQ